MVKGKASGAEARERLGSLRTACLAIGVSVALVGCTSYDTVPLMPSAADDPSLYRPSIEGTYHVQVGDALTINSYYDNHLQQDVVVGPDGRVSLLLIGDQMVAGKTLRELSDSFKAAYAKFLSSPDVTVILKDSPSESVYVGGEVNKPGLEPMKADTTLIQGLSVAGGMLPSGDEKQVLLFRRQKEGELKVFKINAQDVLTNKSPDVYLRRYDIVYVPRSGITDIDLFISQYLSQTVPQWLRYNLDYQWVNGSTAVITSH